MRHATRSQAAVRRFVAGVLLTAVSASTTRGESGIVCVQPPQAGPAAAPVLSKLSGLRLTVDSRWSGAYGYRPVRFRFECPTPANADRSLTVVLHLINWGGAQSGVVVEQDLDLPAGQASATLTMAAPEPTTRQFIHWDVWVDGVLDRDLSRPVTDALQAPQVFPEAVQVLRHAGAPQSTPLGNNQALVNQSSTSRETGIDETRQPLPGRWLLLSGLDVVQITADELRAVANREPKTLDALRRWVATGGSLFVEQTGKRFERLPAVTELLGVDRGPWLEPEAESDGPNRDLPQWAWAEIRPPGQPPSPTPSGSPLANGGQRRAVRPIVTRNWFAEASLGFGVVAAFPESWDKAWAPNPIIPLTRAQNRLKVAFAEHWRERRWTERHGLAPDAANVDFSTLLIPGVGLAPVTEFRVLITLFVLVAGPLNFWALRRRHRGHLVVLTVPLTGAALTFGLFAYALLSDGFGVRARARSVTFLDQKRGEQTTWSRNCYYAGMAPADGLAFSDETACYSVLPGWEDPMSGVAVGGAQRTVEWRPGEQRLRRGWLPARESTQLLAVTSRACGARVEVATDADKIVATNRLGVDARLLIVRDEQGGFWVGEDLAVDEPATLASTERPDAVIALRRLTSENEPTLPAGLLGREDNVFLEQQERRRRQQLRRQYGIEYASSTRVRENRMNGVLNRLTGADGSTPLGVPPRSYVAVTNKHVHGDLGLDRLTESGSFHVVIGSW